MPDIYLPDPKDVNFDKVVGSGQAPIHGDLNNTADSPVYGMAGPSPNYSISPTQELTPSGVENDPKSIDDQTSDKEVSRSNSKSRSPSNERRVSFPDTSLPPPTVNTVNTCNTQTGPTAIENLQGKVSNQVIPESSTTQLSTSGTSAVTSNGTMPPVIGPPPGTYAVRLPATVPSHLPPATQIPPHEHHQQPLQIPPSLPHIPPSHSAGHSHPLPPYSHPPPHMHDLRRGPPPPGHIIPPSHLPPRNVYGIDKDGYIDDPLAAFERAMAMKDASKGRIPPPRYDARGLRRRYYSPERSHRYSSRSPPRYRDRRSPFHRRSPTPPHYRERRVSRSPVPQRPISSKSPEDRGQPKGPKTPPHPHPLRENSTPPESMIRNESPPPPPGTQSPESKRSPSRPKEPEKEDMRDSASTSQQTSTESKIEPLRSPAPNRSRSFSREHDMKRRSTSPQQALRDKTRSPGPYYRRSPTSDKYRYSPSRRHSPPPGAGYDYSNHNHEYYYRHERQAPPPPDDFYDHRRHADYNHPPREIYGNHRESGYGARDRYPPNAPYRNDYRDRGRGYGYRGRGRGHGYNHYYPDNRKNYYNEEHNPHHYPRSHLEYDSMRHEHQPQRSRSGERSPAHINRDEKSGDREIPSKDKASRGATESRRKDRSNSRDRTPSLTPEPEFREQQERNNTSEGQNRKEHVSKSEDHDSMSKHEKDMNETNKDKRDEKSFRKEEHDTHGQRDHDRTSKLTEKTYASGRRRSRSRSYERREKDRERDKRDYEKRDGRSDSSRTRNKELDYNRSREYRDAESNHRDRRRLSPSARERNERYTI